MREYRPEPLKRLVEGLFKERRRGAVLTVSRLRENWADIVGDDLAQKTRPVRLRRETLWLAAPDSSWAFNLLFVKEEILDSVHTFLQSDDVGDLRFVVRDFSSPEGADNRAPPIGPPPVKGEPPTNASDCAPPASEIPGGAPMLSAIEQVPPAPDRSNDADDGGTQATDLGREIPDAHLRDVFVRAAAKLLRRRRDQTRSAGDVRLTDEDRR